MGLKLASPFYRVICSAQVWPSDAPSRDLSGLQETGDQPEVVYFGAQSGFPAVGMAGMVGKTTRFDSRESWVRIFRLPANGGWSVP